MPTTAPRPLARRLLSLPMAPLRWVERARGRWRLALLALYGMIALAIGLVIARFAALRDLPDLGDPFDVAAFRAARPAPDPEDAWPLFERTAAQWKPRTFAGPDALALASALRVGWAKADPGLRSWVAENRAALATWCVANEQSRVVTPRDAAGHRQRPGWALAASSFTWLAQLEASRLMDEGDMDAAWAMIRANLRSARHVGAIDPLGMDYGGQFYLRMFVKPQVETWAADPRVDATRLRRALADVQALDAIPDQDLDAFKEHYIRVMQALEDPPAELIAQADEDLKAMQDGSSFAYWSQHIAPLEAIRWFLRNEPERSRRVARLIFANWLPHLGPAALRRPGGLSVQSRPGPGFPLTLYHDDPDPAAPTLPGGQSAGSLLAWYDSTLYLKRILPPLESYRAGVQLREANQADLILGLAGQLYAREHGGKKPPSPNALVGPYLKALPAGYVEPTPIDGPPDAGAESPP